MLAPFLIFWITLFLARREIGPRGIIIAILAWAALLAGWQLTGLSPYYFVAAQALLDIVLIFIVFGGDIAIR